MVREEYPPLAMNEVIEIVGKLKLNDEETIIHRNTDEEVYCLIETGKSEKSLFYHPFMLLLTQKRGL
ncbi:MAG: hypothetical protein N3D09_03650 [Archaeoglobaceae archaeon]|nr:hypothetical protein [Archaeoglobaceae archaeon]